MPIETIDAIMQTYLTGQDEQREAQSAARSKNAEEILMDLYNCVERSDKKWRLVRTSKTCGARVLERKTKGNFMLAGTVSVSLEMNVVFKTLSSPPDVAQFERQWSRITCIDQTAQSRADWYVQMQTDEDLPPRDWLCSTTIHTNETVYSTHYYTITRPDRPPVIDFLRAGDFTMGYFVAKDPTDSERSLITVIQYVSDKDKSTFNLSSRGLLLQLKSMYAHFCRIGVHLQRVSVQSLKNSGSLSLSRQSSYSQVDEETSKTGTIRKKSARMSKMLSKVF